MDFPYHLVLTYLDMRRDKQLRREEIARVRDEFSRWTRPDDVQATGQTKTTPSVTRSTD